MDDHQIYNMPLL